MANFQSRDDFKGWLQRRPQPVAAVLGLRAALRVVPMAGAVLKPGGWRGKNLPKQAIILSVLRAMATPWLAALVPNHAAARAAANAAARAAASAAFSAANAASTVASTVASAAFSAADAADAASTVATAADAAAWAALSADASQIEAKLAPAALARRPLWLEGVPGWAETAWAAMKADLPASAPPWDLWARWYERVRDGAAFPGLEARVQPVLDGFKGTTDTEHLALIDALVAAALAGGEAPPEEPGPGFTMQDGVLARRAGNGRNETADEAGQRKLHERILKRLPALKDATDKVGNTHPGLKIVVDEYCDLVQRSFDEIDIDDLWAVGNGVLAHARAFELLNPASSTTYPLEPTHLASLIDVGGLHGGFILGFARGRELTERADQARLAANIVAAIEKPTLAILDVLKQRTRTVETHTRHFIGAIAAGVQAAGWDSARTGHTAYVVTRNALLQIGKLVAAADKKLASSFGISAAAGAVLTAQIDPNSAQTLEWVKFLSMHSAQILSFAEPFPELRAWLASIIEHIDREKDQ